MSATTPNNYNEAPFSVKDWAKQWLGTFANIILNHTKVVILVSMLGGAAGLGYSILKPVRYVSEITFLVEEAKSSMGGGLLSSLGGQLGMDFAGLSGSGNSVISGDNVLTLLTSRKMMADCLKTPFNNAASKSAYSLADRYADVYGYRKAWMADEKIGRIVFFGVPDVNIRLQDSLLKIIIKRIEEKEITISKPDKKLGFFKVNINTKDEALSKLIGERIIKIATDFYVNTKVGRLKNNISKLEKRTDSITALLNYRTSQITESNKLLLNLNPSEVAARVSSEISQRDKIILSTIYTELVKNLEISKTSLIQETPTIQIVDSPVFPLETIQIKWYEGLFMGLLISFMGILFLFLLKGTK